MDFRMVTYDYNITIYFYFRVVWMNMKNVQIGRELDTVPNFQLSCFSIVESLVEPVDSNHVNNSYYGAISI